MAGALIIGHAGQDGRCLAEALRRDGIAFWGWGRSATLGPDGAEGPPVDLSDPRAVRRGIDTVRPDEIYYLAARHHSGEDVPADDGALWSESRAVHADGLVHVLDAVRASLPIARLFYAASSRVFGSGVRGPANEETPFLPEDLYGLTKAMGVLVCRYYRRRFGLFAAVGFLFNHESRFRPARFVSMKIVDAVAAIAAGRPRRLALGDLDAVVDWGHAPDYVDAMRRVLRLPTSDDFVIATGESHTVGEFVEIAFRSAGLNWKEHVDIEPSLLRRPTQGLVGDPARLRARTDWTPRVSFPEMVIGLVNEGRNRP